MAIRATKYSFEFFPPKDQAGEERLWAAMSALEPIAPDFISVTYGAGGSTRDRTIRITSEITERTSIPTVAHLTCVGSTRGELIEILQKYKEAGIRSILALRGDPTGGPSAPWVPTVGGFSHADQLVELAMEVGGFEVGVAAFPDGHPASQGDLAKDVDVLISEFFIKPTRISIALSGTPLENISQKRYKVPNFYTKVNLLNHLLEDSETFNKVLIFVAYKRMADRLFNQIEESFYGQSCVIHSNKAQND